RIDRPRPDREREDDSGAPRTARTGTGRAFVDRAHADLVVLRPLRPRPVDGLAVELQIDALVEEAVEVAHLLRVVLRLGTAPDEALDHAAVQVHVPVRRRALVRAPRAPRARLEQLDSHVLGREVVARR